MEFDITQNIIQKDSSLIFDSVYNCLADTTELQFDGTGDYVQIPSNPAYNFGSNQDFTIECRVRTNTTGDVAIIGNKNNLTIATSFLNLRGASCSLQK